MDYFHLLIIYLTPNDTFTWEEESNFSFREIILFLWNLKYWIAASIFFSLVVVFFYVKIATPSFVKSTIVMIVNDEGSGSNELALLYDLTGKNQTSKIDNEVFILRAPTLMKEVVNELRLNTRYFEYKLPIFHSTIEMPKSFLNIKKVEYYKNNPFAMNVVLDTVNAPQHIYLEFKVKKGNKYQITELKQNGREKRLSKQEYDFGEIVPMNGCCVSLKIMDKARMKEDREFACSWETSYNRALNLVSSLDVSVSQEKNKQTDLILLKKEDSHPLRAEEILNTLIIKYNQQSRDFKNEAGINTINFIDNRLNVIAKELGDVESSMKKYQSANVLVDLESQSYITLTSDAQYETQYNEVCLQLKVLDMIKTYIEETPESEYKVIPANVGVKDNGLNETINQYNTLVAKRNRLLANSSSNNQLVINANHQLADGEKGIELTVANLIQSYSINEKELEKRLKISKKKIASIPIQQFDVTQIARKQQIIEPLYLLLQQKKEEAQISIYSKTDNVRVIETAFGSNAPIKPEKNMLLLLALVIGFMLPPVIMLVRMLFKTKIETVKDIENKVNAAILAVIPKNKESKNLLSCDSRDRFTESFRVLCSNIQFLQGKVFQVTSSIRGEGKSYVSVNLSLCLASTNKKSLAYRA